MVCGYEDLKSSIQHLICDVELSANVTQSFHSCTSRIKEPSATLGFLHTLYHDGLACLTWGCLSHNKFIKQEVFQMRSDMYKSSVPSCVRLLHPILQALLPKFRCFQIPSVSFGLVFGVQ